jgi:hypothetical protein
MVEDGNHRTVSELSTNSWATLVKYINDQDTSIPHIQMCHYQLSTYGKYY